MQKLYFRDDQSASDRYLADTFPLPRGVLFGLSPEAGEAEDAAVIWRVEWHPGHDGRPAWRFGLAYAGDARLDAHPALREGLRRLPATASVDAFCAALERLGFMNGRAKRDAGPSGTLVAPRRDGGLVHPREASRASARRTRLY